jgi:hypothetical protein
MENPSCLPTRSRAGMNRIKATRLPICYRNHHLRRPDIETTDMDDMRKSLSKLKKDFKHRLGGKKRGPDEAGANAAGETASSSLSLTRPDSRVTASGRDEEGSRISTDVSQAHSRDRLLSPSLCKQTKAATTHKGERRTSTKRKPAGAVRAWVRTLGVLREVDPVKKSNEPLPLHPSPRSRPNKNLTVRGRFLPSSRV